MFDFKQPNPGMELERPYTALVFTDLQNEFLEPKAGTYYELIEDSLKERNVTQNIGKLLQTAQELNYPIIHSPHWYYPTDRWTVPGGAIGTYLVGIGFCGRKDPVDLEGFEGSRADYYEPFKPYLKDGKTSNCSPHKHFGTSSNDVVKQLHMRRIRQVIMAGPAGNICLESHMRDLIEAGFEVAMVTDAAGAASNEMGDGYVGQMVNWRFMANALWTTEEAVEKLKAAAENA